MNMPVIDSFKGEYSFLSNMQPCKIIHPISKLEYASSEHYYQASKFSDKDMYERVRLSKNGYEAKNRAKKHSANWSNFFNLRKLAIMRDAVHFKFNQNKDLREKLIATDGIYLIEGNSWNDTFWGVCDGVGYNFLGSILMEERYNIIQHKTLRTIDEFLK